MKVYLINEKIVQNTLTLLGATTSFKEVSIADFVNVADALRSLPVKGDEAKEVANSQVSEDSDRE